MKSRQEILSYKDQELIDYYDECIVSFEDYQAKAEKVRNLRQDYWKHLNLHQLVSCGWVLALLFLIFGTVGLWSESHPAMTTMTTEERETIDFFRDLLSIEAKQSYDRIGEDFNNTLHSGILVFCRGIILLSATAFVILLFIFLTKRKIYRSEFIEAKRNYTTYFNSLKYELDDPSNKINDALLMFSGPDALDTVKELRGIVFNSIASTHKEAQMELQRRIERTEDKKQFDALVDAIKEGSKKDMLDKLEKIGTIAGLFK